MFAAEGEVMLCEIKVKYKSYATSYCKRFPKILFCDILARNIMYLNHRRNSENKLKLITIFVFLRLAD